MAIPIFGVLFTVIMMIISKLPHKVVQTNIIIVFLYNLIGHLYILCEKVIFVPYVMFFLGIFACDPITINIGGESVTPGFEECWVQIVFNWNRAHLYISTLWQDHKNSLFNSKG